MEQDLKERIATLEAHTKNVFHQLDEIKESLHEVHHLTGICEGISAKLSLFERALSETNVRVQELENIPAKDLSHYRRSLVVYLITALVGSFGGALLCFLGGA